MDIIYILGSGRSGSTLLERVLNSSPTAFAVGELHSLWRDDMSDLQCSCGAWLTRCPFWSEVLTTLSFGASEWEECRRQERQIIRHHYVARRRFSLAALASDPRVQDAIELQGRIFDAIRCHAGDKTLIDSSKVPPRAWILANIPGIRFVHLRRSATDVIGSWRLPKWDKNRNTSMTKLTFWAAAIDWWKPEQTARMFAKQRPLKRLDYRAFATDPWTALEGTFGETHPQLVRTIKWRDPFTVEPSNQYHSVMGNPDRYDAEPIRIQFRQADLNELPLIERLAARTFGKLLDTAYP